MEEGEEERRRGCPVQGNRVMRLLLGFKNRNTISVVFVY